MAANKYTSRNHLYLLPDKSKATFTNLFKDFLFSRNISESELLSHNIISLKKENKFLHRVAIFISLLIQTFFHYISEPLKKFGNVVEDFLNFGVTERDSENYYTVIGLLTDSRVELNKEIKRGDANYYPALTMMASKLAYDNEAVIKMAVNRHLKMDFVGFYDFYNEFQQKPKTHAYIFREKNEDGDVIIVAFRGTSLFDSDNWISDFDFSWVEFDGMGKSHLGFMIALGLNKYSQKNDDALDNYLGSWPKEITQDPQQPLAYYTLREKLKKMLASNPNSKIIVTGHSLGGALAILFSSILAFHEEVDLLQSMDAIYTYGQPRVGDEEFGEFVTRSLKEHNVKYDRIAYGYDIVPKVPFDNALMEFKHIGRGIHFNSLYKGKVIKEEKNQNIILWILKAIIGTLINFVVARLIAIWEVIRGLFMRFVKGSYYKERWLIILLRIFLGIPIPSFMNHFPHDYVNSTCLASEGLFSKPYNHAFLSELEFENLI